MAAIYADQIGNKVNLVLNIPFLVDTYFFMEYRMAMI